MTKSRLFGIFLLLQFPFAMSYVILLLDRSRYSHGIVVALTGIVFPCDILLKLQDVLHSENSAKARGHNSGKFRSV